MNKIQNTTILIILEKSDDGYWVSVPDLPGCYSVGNTPQSAIDNTREAIQEHISGLKETGEDIPQVFLNEVKFKIKYDLQSLFETFKFINKSAFAKMAGINPSLLRQYTKGLAFASNKQKAKIEHALHEIGKNFEAVCL